MSVFTYDVEYEGSRSRLTVAFRFILAIPHLIVSEVWGVLAQILALVQWFIILFTGKRNQGIWDMQQSWLGYYGRVLGYIYFLFDEYPAFGTDPGAAPVRSAISYEEPANRLTNALRMIWIIPAYVVGFVVGIGAAVILLISWFAIVITGKQSRGMWDFVLKYTRFMLQLQSYGLLMTDTYPKYGDGAMTATASPPPPASSPVPPPPPPPPS